MSWRETTLGECARFLSGGTPRKAVAEYWNGDIPWVGSGEMSESFIRDTALRVTREGAQNGSRLVPENTVLVVVRGMSLAKDFRISLTMREMTFNQDVKALVCTEGITPRFLFYALKARKDHIRDLATDASHGTKKLETDQLKAVAIKVPESVNEQEKVASILSAYDDLIENNRRRIGLLEQAARLLYREWFVQLRFPGHETAKIVDGLPEGWRTTTFDAVCDTIGGGTPSTKNPEFWEDGDVTWVTPTDITRNDCLALLESEKKITSVGLKKSSAKMVPPNTILMTSRASVGFFGLADFPVSTNQGFINIVPHDETMRYYLLFNLLHRVDEIRGHASGATYAEISKGKFRALPVVIPSEKTAATFHSEGENIINQVRTIAKQNAKLTRARDLLLPRLMDGRIPV